MFRNKKKGVIQEKLELGLQLIIGLVLVVYSSMALMYYISPQDSTYQALFSVILIQFILILFGIFMVYDALKRKMMLRPVNFGIGLFLFLFALFPILNDLKLLRWLPFNIDLTVNFVLLALVLLFSSLYFIVDRFFVIFKKDYS